MTDPDFLSLQYKEYCEKIDAANKRFAHTEAVADLVSDNRALQKAMQEADKIYRRELAKLNAEIEELVCVLRMLFEEQNDAPNERRREQWQLAMNECRITLKKFDP